MSSVYTCAMQIFNGVWLLVTARAKNDRRNSGGTLRQKFNHIDFRHLTFNQWTTGPLDQGTNGPMDQWTTGPMNQWSNGTMAQLMTLMTLKISPTYPQDIPKIYPRYPKVIPKISPRFLQDIKRDIPKISQRYPKISPRYS